MLTATAPEMAAGSGLTPSPARSTSRTRWCRNSAGGANGPDCGSSINQFLSGGHNLIGSTSGCTGFGPPNSTDIVNPPSSKIKIGTLDNHGGPTNTIALKAGSWAINHGGQDEPKRDQRGVKRGKRPDIGAFEKT